MAVGFFFFPSFKGVGEYLSQECSFSKKPFFSQTVEEKTKAPFQSCSSADIIKVRRESGNSHLSATSFLLQRALSGSNISRLFSCANISDAGGSKAAAGQRSALHRAAFTANRTLQLKPAEGRVAIASRVISTRGPIVQHGVVQFA